MITLKHLNTRHRQRQAEIVKFMKELELPLLVLAGGFGTRLRQLVSDVPKPMAPVEGHPFISYLLKRWWLQGVRKYVFLLHYEADVFENYILSIKDTMLPGCTVSFIVEPEPLGTGGAVAFAIQQLKLQDSFLLANADTYLESGISEIALASVPSIGCIYVDDASRYGKVEMSDGKVLAFKEKQLNSNGGWINAGIAHLHTDVFNFWDGKPFSLESEVYPKLSSHGNLTAVKLESKFIDIGIPEDYLKFCSYINSEMQGNS